MILSISGKKGSGKDLVGKIIQYWSICSWDTYLEDKEDGTVMAEMNGAKSFSEWEIKKFAGKVKEVCSIITGVPLYLWEDNDFKQSYLDSNWDLDIPVSTDPQSIIDGVHYTKKFSVRSMMQKVGTDAIRDMIHPNTWITALFADYKLVSAKFGTIDYSNPNVKFQQIGDESVIEYPNWIITDTRFPNEIEAIKKRGGITINVVRNNGTRTIDIHPSETSLDTYIFDHVLDNDSDIDSLMVKVRTLLQTLKLIE